MRFVLTLLLLSIAVCQVEWFTSCTVKIIKFGTPQTIAIIVLKIEKFDIT